MQRDKLGRFVKGNTMAKGNKGNRYPKFGNKNAIKHGFFSAYNIAIEDSNGNLCIYLSMSNVIRIPPSHFFRDDLGRIRIHDDFVDVLESMNIKLEDS